MDASRRESSLLKYHLISFVFFLLAFEAAAQNAPVSCQAQYEQGQSSAGESVAAAARSSKNQKTTHAKKVFSDEDM